MWTYYAFRIAGVTLSYLPMRAGYLIARLTADLVYLLYSALGAAVEDNMRHVLGREANHDTVRQASRGVLRSVARNYFDLVKLPRINPTQIEHDIAVKGWHNLESALERRKGVVLVTAHFGSFEMSSQIFPVRSVKTTIPVEPLQPPALLDHVTALRNSKGLNVIPARPGVLNVLIKNLRRGEVVLLACDRDVAGNGLRSDFFGEETSLPTLAVRLAMRTGAALVPAFGLRQEDGRCSVCFEPAIDVTPSGDGAVIQNLHRVTQAMEQYISSYPDQWLVLSPVWRNGQSHVSTPEDTVACAS